MTKTMASAWIALLLACPGANTASAQLTAQLTGTVRDASGGVVPGAAIVVISEETGIKRQANTNQAGTYTVPLLQPGVYRITIQSEGFRSVSRSGIRLEVAQTATLDFSLQVGSLAESIDVTDTAHRV